MQGFTLTSKMQGPLVSRTCERSLNCESGFTLTPKEQGFTLIEILVVMVITGIFGIALLGLQYIISQNQVEVWKNYLSVDDANANITRLVRELRNARTGDNGAYALVQADDQELIFYADIDYDGETERVRYTLVDTEFTRGIIEPTGFPVTYPSDQEKTNVVAENVRNVTDPIFYYYNGDWPEDTTNNPLDTPTRLSDTKLMRLYLKVNQTDDTTKDYILESYVQIRSLKENL
jgi:prepilin-type N-terminal cleavage/methylation domain-containing protein